MSLHRADCFTDMANRRATAIAMGDLLLLLRRPRFVGPLRGMPMWRWASFATPWVALQFWSPAWTSQCACGPLSSTLFRSSARPAPRWSLMGRASCLWLRAPSRTHTSIPRARAASVTLVARRPDAVRPSDDSLSLSPLSALALPGTCKRADCIHLQPVLGTSRGGLCGRTQSTHLAWAGPPETQGQLLGSTLPPAVDAAATSRRGTVVRTGTTRTAIARKSRSQPRVECGCMRRAQHHDTRPGATVARWRLGYIGAL